MFPTMWAFVCGPESPHFHLDTNTTHTSLHNVWKPIVFGWWWPALRLLWWVASQSYFMSYYRNDGDSSSIHVPLGVMNTIIGFVYITSQFTISNLEKGSLWFSPHCLLWYVSSFLWFLPIVLSFQIHIDVHSSPFIHVSGSPFQWALFYKFSSCCDDIIVLCTWRDIIGLNIAAPRYTQFHLRPCWYCGIHMQVLKARMPYSPARSHPYDDCSWDELGPPSHIYCCH